LEHLYQGLSTCTLEQVESNQENGMIDTIINFYSLAND